MAKNIVMNVFYNQTNNHAGNDMINALHYQNIYELKYFRARVNSDGTLFETKNSALSLENLVKKASVNGVPVTLSVGGVTQVLADLANAVNNNAQVLCNNIAYFCKHFRMQGCTLDFEDTGVNGAGGISGSQLTTFINTLRTTLDNILGPGARITADVQTYLLSGTSIWSQIATWINKVQGVFVQCYDEAGQVGQNQAAAITFAQNEMASWQAALNSSKWNKLFLGMAISQTANPWEQYYPSTVQTLDQWARSQGMAGSMIWNSYYMDDNVNSEGVGAYWTALGS
jgi:hypothetical protein